MSNKRKKPPVVGSIDLPASTSAMSEYGANQQDLAAEKLTVEGEAAAVYEDKDNVETDNEVKSDVKKRIDADAEHSELSNADTQSGLGSRTLPETEAVATKDIQQGEKLTLLPQDIRVTIATLLSTVDLIDSKFKEARELILELARLLDERGLCKRDQISIWIKKILEDKIQEGKITKQWISECLPEDYKRKYDKSKSKLSLLSKQDKDKDTEQDQAELAVEQEPRQKREVLVQADTSGHSIQELRESGDTNADTGTNTYTDKQSSQNEIISFKPQQQEVTEAQPEANPAKTHEIGDSNDNTAKSSPVPSLQYVEWRECSFPFNDVRNMVSQAQNKDRDKFWFCVKLDRPATIVGIRLGRLNGGDISHD